MTDIIILATARVLPAGAASFGAALRGFAHVTRQQPGCRAYDVFYGAEDPLEVAIVERWATAEDAAIHLSAPHTAAFLDSIAGWIEGDAGLRARDAA